MRSTILLLFLLHFTSNLQAESSSTHTSQIDLDLTIKRVSYFPTYDNLNGLFANHIDELLKANIEENHQWDFVPSQISKNSLTPDDLILNQSRTLKASGNLKADGIFFAGLRKNPKDLLLEMNLFSLKSGRLISRASKNIANDSTLEVIKSEMNSLYNSVVLNIPYEGTILSRTGNRVTIDVGELNGATPGVELSAVRIIAVERHPSLGFIVKTEKDILGKVRIVKSSKFLSFADVITEKEPGVISKDAKIIGLNFIKYSSKPWTKVNDLPPRAIVNDSNKSIYGDDPDLWRPEYPPTFGKIGLTLAIGEYANSVNLNNDRQLNSNNIFYPRLIIDGEIWLNPTWYFTYMVGQGLSPMKNPVAGASPATQTHSLTEYGMTFGGNYLFKNDFYGPKIYGELGFYNYKMFIDASTPEGLQSSYYFALITKGGVLLPLFPEIGLNMGAEIVFYLFPALKEAPLTSGSDSNNSINHFLLFGETALSPRFNLRGGLEFRAFNSSFSGDGSRAIDAKTSTHRYTNIRIGLHYLF